MVKTRKEAIKDGQQRYNNGKPCLRGHFSERYTKSGSCLECVYENEKEGKYKNSRKAYRERSKEKIKERDKKYYDDNKEKILGQHKEYRSKNKENAKAYSTEYRKLNAEVLKIKKKKYYLNNREKALETCRKYREDNKIKVNETVRKWRLENRGYQKLYFNSRYKNDIEFKTANIIRSILKRTLLNTGESKNEDTYLLIGYTARQLVTDITSKLGRGMTWDNYGKWHIDHLYPVSRFMSEGVTCPKIINDLANLAPMWANHNWEKGQQTLEEWLHKKGVGSEEWSLYSKYLKEELNNGSGNSKSNY